MPRNPRRKITTKTTENLNLFCRKKAQEEKDILFELFVPFRGYFSYCCKKSKKEMPNSRYAFEKSLALPMFHELTEKDIDYIVMTLKSFIS